MSVGSGDFQELVGEHLSGVTFVRDYLQLQFNPPPLLNAYTPVRVRRGDQVAVFGEKAFANLLIGLIDTMVRAVTLRPDDALEITFEDDSMISVSLRADDYVGPEALNLFRKDGGMVVI